MNLLGLIDESVLENLAEHINIPLRIEQWLNLWFVRFIEIYRGNCSGCNRKIKFTQLYQRAVTFTRVVFCFSFFLYCSMKGVDWISRFRRLETEFHQQKIVQRTMWLNVVFISVLSSHMTLSSFQQWHVVEVCLLRVQGNKTPTFSPIQFTHKIITASVLAPF